VALLIRAVVRRHMKETGRFVDADCLDDFPAPLTLAADESLIGWYRNPEPWANCFVVFTDKSIYSVEGDNSIRIDMDDIIDYESPKSKKYVSGLRVRVRDGFRFVRIAGSFGPYGQYKDAFSFMNVVRRLVARNARESNPK
jgi:hypothetical protein